MNRLEEFLETRQAREVLSKDRSSEASGWSWDLLSRFERFLGYQLSDKESEVAYKKFRELIDS